VNRRASHPTEPVSPYYPESTPYYPDTNTERNSARPTVGEGRNNELNREKARPGFAERPSGPNANSF